MWAAACTNSFPFLESTSRTIDMSDQASIAPLLPTLKWLGYGGLIPFFVLSLLALLSGGDAQAFATTALTLYGISIVTFVGAVSWGMALASTAVPLAARKRLLIWSVAPSLVAVSLWFLPDTAPLGALAVLAILSYRMDQFHGRALGWPPAWIRLRLHLTIGVCLCLLPPFLIL